MTKITDSKIYRAVSSSEVKRYRIYFFTNTEPKNIELNHMTKQIYIPLPFIRKNAPYWTWGWETPPDIPHSREIPEHGDENIIEVIQVCPSVIQLKSTVKGFQRRDQPVGCYGGQQVLHLLHILRRGAQAVYKEGGTMPETAVLPVSDETDPCDLSGKIVYGFPETPPYRWRKRRMWTILSHSGAVSPFALQTNLTAITESGRFYTFDLRYAPGCEDFSFIVDKQDTKKAGGHTGGRERNTRQKALLEKEISRRPEAADQYQGRGGRHEISTYQYLCGQWYPAVPLPGCTTVPRSAIP